MVHFKIKMIILSNWNFIISFIPFRFFSSIHVIYIPFYIKIVNLPCYILQLIRYKRIFCNRFYAQLWKKDQNIEHNVFNLFVHPFSSLFLWNLKHRTINSFNYPKIYSKNMFIVTVNNYFPVTTLLPVVGKKNQTG